jgi:hypothetical protein
MRIFAVILFLFSLAAAAVPQTVRPPQQGPGVGPAPAPDAGVDAARYATAYEIAQLFDPFDLSLTGGQFAFGNALQTSVAAQPGGSIFLAKYPGIVEAVSDAAKPLLQEQLSKLMPRLWAIRANLHAKNMSSAELAQAKRFMESRAGRAFVAAVFANMKMESGLASLVKNPEGGVSAKDMFSDSQSAGVRAFRSVSPQDRAAITAFLGSVVGRKIIRLNPEYVKAAMVVANESDPAFDARMGAVISSTISDFVKKADAARAQASQSTAF